MAFVVEDGTGLSTATSYASVAFFRDYFTERGQATSTYLDAAVQQALVIAADYIGYRWANRLMGEREYPSVQALEYPRVNLYLHGVEIIGVPDAVKRAACEYGYKYLTAGALLVDSTNTAQSYGQVAKSTTVVGPIEKTVEYRSSANTFPEYRVADQLMRKLCFSGRTAIRE